MRHLLSRLRYSLPAGLFCSAVAISASATDKALLDILDLLLNLLKAT